MSPYFDRAEVDQRVFGMLAMRQHFDLDHISVTPRELCRFDRDGTASSTGKKFDERVVSARHLIPISRLGPLRRLPEAKDECSKRVITTITD